MEEILNNINAPIAEIGVSIGYTFRNLFLPASIKVNQMAYAYDSWTGMGERSIFDSEQYPKGKFNINGKHEWQKNYMQQFKEGVHYIAYEGFVPHNLFMTPANIKFYYIRLDLDHYLPTLVAAHWAYARLNPGGFLSSHDYFPGRITMATRGINMFLNDIGDRMKLINYDKDSTEIILKKL